MYTLNSQPPWKIVEQRISASPLAIEFHIKEIHEKQEKKHSKRNNMDEEYYEGSCNENIFFFIFNGRRRRNPKVSLRDTK